MRTVRTNKYSRKWGVWFTNTTGPDFDRTALYARKIREFLTSTPPTSQGKEKASVLSSSTSLHLPVDFNNHISRVVAALHTHLSPLLHLSSSSSSSSCPSSLLAPLHTLTIHAALISLHMHLSPTTTYRFIPVSTHDPFLPTEMDCFNHASMLATPPRESSSPSAAEQPRRAGQYATRDDAAVVQIAIMPGMVAYRRGEDETDASTAVCSRRLMRGWGYCC